jgi:heparin/heparan-sulfate lyase
MKSLLPLLFASAALAQTWTTYDGVSIPIPPAEHPRLYLRARDLPDLERRTAHPALKPVYDRLATLGRQSPALGLEYDALRYLLTRDDDLARRTAAVALKLLEDSTFDMAKQDITRPIGRLMVTGAIVYDWTYPVLTADQKARYVDRLRYWATKLECGYPPPKQAVLTGHFSEWMLMRDMLSAGVAIYDEFPEMYQLAANRFFGLYVPVRNWWYQGGAFHQGSAYAETRASSELYPLWIFARMGFGSPYDPALQRLPYEWIYERRPDDQLLRNGDGQFKSPGLRSLLNASFYNDGYVLADWLREPRTSADGLIFEFLWRDPDLQPKPIAELPLTHYMGTPYGWMVARTGWDADAAIAEMKVNEYNFANHQHLDAGDFQLYYKGALAIDSGVYEGTGGGYGSPHDVNYNKRTIAHNSLLIYDPAETFTRSRATLRNDGGQRLPNGWREPRNLEDVQANYRTGEVLGHAGNDSYAYLHGDITRAYSEKARKVERSFVFLNLKGERVKAALIVFDRVLAANPDFKRYWLLHSINEPKVEGNTITVNHGGKLVDQVLLPERVEITPVGGEGKEFWVFGENFPSKPRTADSEVGGWRVEVSSTADTFLNVMQMMDPDVAPLPVKKLTNGVEVANTTVLFENPGRIQSRGRFLIAGIAEGEWRVRGPVTRSIHVTRDEHALWFEGPAGAYTVEMWGRPGGLPHP